MAARSIFQHERQPSIWRAALGAVLLSALAISVCLGAAYALLLWSDENGPFRHHTATVDLDGDGDLDVMVHSARFLSEVSAFSGVTLWFNQGDGSFLKVVPDMGSAGADAADVDGDGDADIVTMAADQMTVFLNQGGIQGGQKGTFKRNKPILPPADLPESAKRNLTYGSGLMGTVTLGDLNGDGLADGLAAGCCGVSNPEPPENDGLGALFSWVWINRWDATEWAVLDTLSLPTLDDVAVGAAAMGDLNGDGSQDVFAAVRTPKPGHNSEPGNQVLLNDGAGNLRDSGQRLGDDDNTCVSLGDVDADGDLDALVGSQSGAVVWLNQGDGTFNAGKQEISGRGMSAVFLADLDGDDDPDALAGDERRLTIWWNNGQGSFAEGGPRLPFSEQNALAVGDFNGDGRADLFVATYGEGYRVWWNEGNKEFR